MPKGLFMICGDNFIELSIKQKRIMNKNKLNNASKEQSKLQGCSQGSEIPDYSALIEGIEEEYQNTKKQTLQPHKIPPNFVFAFGRSRSQRQASFTDDNSQISSVFMYNRNENLMFPSFFGHQQSGKQMITKPLKDSSQSRLKLSEQFLVKKRSGIKIESPVVEFEQQKVQLGREIIMSVEKYGLNTEQQPIQEESQIINRLQSTDKRSHFQIAKVQVDYGNMFQQFQQPRKIIHQSRHGQFKIFVSPEPGKLSSHFNIEQSNTSVPIFAVQSITKRSMKSEVKQEKYKKSAEQVKLSSKNGKPQQNEQLNSKVLKSSKIKSSEHNQIQSKIITQGQMNSSQKKSVNSDIKKTIIQVPDRMKSTVDLQPTSEYRVVPIAANLSEPDKHSIHNATKMKITDPLSPSEESPQKKEGQNNLGTDIQGYLIAKMQKIEKLVDNLKQSSYGPVSMAKCDHHDGVHSLEQKKIAKNQLGKPLHNLIADEFLNGLSSIRSEENSHQKYKNQGKNQLSEQFNKKFQFLAERILKIEEIILKKSSKQCNCGFFQQIIQRHDHKLTKINSPKRGSVQQTKVKKVKSQTKIYEPRYESSFPDQDFVKLQALMSKFDIKVQRNSSPEQLAELGIKILNYFKIKTHKGQSMDMAQHQNSVQFYYQNSNVYIRVQFSGLFYIGDGENSQQFSQFIKQGEGIQIMLNKYIYKGHFQQDKKDGDGMISYILGDKYKGQWSNDLYHGQGILYSKTSQYRGTFYEGKKHDFGREKFKNGDFYQGEYYMNSYNGTGKYIWNNGTVYEGDFANDQMSGKGVWISENGDVYEGQFYKGKRQGYGRYTKINGEVLQGEFSKGYLAKRTCKGILQAQKELNFEQGQEQAPRMAINDPYNTKFNAPKAKKIIIERQQTDSSRIKSKRYSKKW